MTRRRSPHDYHEVKVLNPETICSKCGAETGRICEWCGICKICHGGHAREQEQL